MSWIGDLVAQLNLLVEHHAGAWWVLLVLFALAALDGFIPPLPSESVLITLAVYSAAGTGPNPLLIGALAAAGGFLGDNLAYGLGRRSRLDRLRDSRHRRLRTAFRWAERELGQRGGILIVVARYIPIGRIAVNVTAGATRFPHKTFMVFDAIAVTTWAAYSVAVGYLFGNWLHEQPLLGALLGILFAVLVGAVADRLIQRWTGDSPAPEEG